MTKHLVAIMCDPLGSNSMKSPNPHSGFHRIFVAPCLDTSSQSPQRNQGGMVIVQGSSAIPRPKTIVSTGDL